MIKTCILLVGAVFLTIPVGPKADIPPPESEQTALLKEIRDILINLKAKIN